MLSLSNYGMSRERGFLASFDPGAVELPLRLQPVREMARAIPQLICTGPGPGLAGTVAPD